MSKKTKLIAIIVCIAIIVSAIIVVCVKGFKFDTEYANGQKVELNIGQQFDRKDIKNITDEVFGKQPVSIQEIEVYKDAVSITTTEISDEQKSNLVTKVNEKYGTDLKVDDITTETISHVRGRDIFKPYAQSFGITTIIILVYFAIRYHKTNTIKVILKSLCTIIVCQALLFSVIAITRIPVGRVTISAMFAVYVISLFLSENVLSADKKTKE